MVSTPICANKVINGPANTKAVPQPAKEAAMHTVPVLVITSGHRTISGYLCHMTDQSRKRADKMSGQKRAVCSDEVPPAKKRGVSVKTVQK